jgi:hypothetical protein
LSWNETERHEINAYRFQTVARREDRLMLSCQGQWPVGFGPYLYPIPMSFQEQQTKKYLALSKN